MYDVVCCMLYAVPTVIVIVISWILNTSIDTQTLELEPARSQQNFNMILMMYVLVSLQY